MTNYKKRLIIIFVPIMLSNLISQIQMLIDRIFLGRLNVLYMSAVGNATAPVWTTMAFVFSLVIGSSILISQSIGAGDEEKAKEYAASMFKYHNVVPVILFFFWTFCCPFVYKLMGVSENVMGPCVTYTRIYAPVFLLTGLGAACNVVLQTSNHTKHMITYGIIRSVLNVILDYLLIFGKFGFPEMGIAGAALATTIAEYAGAIFIFVYLINSKSLKTKPDFNSVLKAPAAPYFSSIKLGINTACEDFIWNLGNLIMMRILNSINEMAAGIYSIVFSLEILAVVIIGALGNATVTLTGESTGAKDFKTFRKIVGTAYLWSAIVSGVTLIMVILFPEQILSIFTKDQGIISSSTLFLMLVGFNLFSKSANIIVGSGIRGFGDTKWMLFTQIYGTCFISGVACLMVFWFKAGMIGVYIAVLCDEFTRAVINTIRFMKIRFEPETKKQTVLTD